MAEAGTTEKTKLVIAASSLGTIFEWYDFYLYGLLATILSAQFFSGVNETTGFILALAAFAAGFFVRPFGAICLRPDRRPRRPQEHLPRHHGHHGLLDLRGRTAAELRNRRRARADAAGAAAAAAGPRARRAIWRRRDLRCRACARRQARLLHQLDPDHRDARPVRDIADRHRHALGDWRGSVRRLGLADPVPAVGAAASGVAVDPTAAQREPGLPADEGGRRDVAGAAARKPSGNGRTCASSSSLCSAPSPARRWSGTPASSTPSSSSKRR